MRFFYLFAAEFRQKCLYLLHLRGPAGGQTYDLRAVGELLPRAECGNGGESLEAFGVEPQEYLVGEGLECRAEARCREAVGQTCGRVDGLACDVEV